MGQQPMIERVNVRVYRIPTETPESDGTFAWDATTLVVVQVEAGKRRGLGYTYGAPAVASVVRDLLVPALLGQPALGLPALWDL